MSVHDRRLNAFRPDLADERLRGTVDAARFVAGEAGRITVPVADMRRAPRPDAGLDTQLLRGETVRVFDNGEGWAWVQAARDGYVGYVAGAALSTETETPTHVVSVPRTYIYSGPDMKLPATGVLSLGSALAIVGSAETRGTEYALLAAGAAIVTRHLRDIGVVDTDYVAVAETLLGAPYLWGGASAFGIDCSGLVQLSMRMTGVDVLRDTDMQATAIGTPLDPGRDFSGLRRGDLVFWKGHVAVMTDARTILHANGHTMTVAGEPLREAIDRIGYLYGGPTGFRRP